jgi:hypothetical protein
VIKKRDDLQSINLHSQFQIYLLFLTDRCCFAWGMSS